MKALILCAGLGTRLGKLTKDTPKPMIDVAGFPVLAHLIYHLYKYNIRNIMVNLHHHPLKIMEYFGSMLLYTYEPVLLGEKGTIDTLQNWLIDDYVVVMNGDTLTNIDIQKMYELSKIKNVSIKSMDGDIYTGTMILHPSYFYKRGKFAKYYDADLYWQDIGTPEGLEKARKDYEKFDHLREL